MADTEIDTSQLDSKMQTIDMNMPIEGDITVPGAPEEDDETAFSTLDEPIRETIMRDLNAVFSKFLHVLYPKQSKTLLREWDLWGPLILCTLLAMMLQASDEKKTEQPQFSEVFVLVSFGSVIVTLNSKLLGGLISFFQTVCILGYCLLPLNVALIFCRLLLLSSNQYLFIVRLIVTFIAFFWSTLASLAFLADSQPPNKKGLALYPICLFYFVIAWLILGQTA
ncbi:protein YIPF6-like [Antedon mediterranea]|uniref:protein YIPF6-like n=1 Tax=Antedon mediterranea TaxID=105859 RepID=UPI003AF848DB